MVNASGQVLHGALAKLVDPEHKVINVGDAIDVVLKDVDAERMEQVWGGKRRERERAFGYPMLLKTLWSL